MICYFATYIEIKSESSYNNIGNKLSFHSSVSSVAAFCRDDPGSNPGRVDERLSHAKAAVDGKTPVEVLS